MKLKNLILTSGLCAVVGLAILPAVFAEDAGHDMSEMEMKMPDTVEGLLAAIQKHEDELKATIAAKKLDDVHHHAFAIRDLAKALGAKAPADKKARVDGAVNNIGKLATALDASGDAGEQAKTEANLKQFDAVLTQLQAQFK